MKEKNVTKLTITLLGIYIILIIWIILFKMQFNMSFLPYIRSINLIPFSASVITNGQINISEIINNLIIFIPVGAYIQMLWKDKKIYKKILIPFTISLILEILQFVLHVGATDITDILMNTLGGFIGILFVQLLYKIFKNEKKVDKVLNVLALIATVLLIAFIMILIISNL